MIAQRLTPNERTNDAEAGGCAQGRLDFTRWSDGTSNTCDGYSDTSRPGSPSLCLNVDHKFASCPTKTVGSLLVVVNALCGEKQMLLRVQLWSRSTTTQGDTFIFEHQLKISGDVVVTSVASQATSVGRDMSNDALVFSCNSMSQALGRIQGETM